MSEVNIMKHQLVPEHHLLTEKEGEKVLKKYEVTKEQLPKIRKDDPIIRFLERVEGEIPRGRIIKIIRESEVSGVSESYRVVI